MPNGESGNWWEWVGGLLAGGGLVAMLSRPFVKMRGVEDNVKENRKDIDALQSHVEMVRETRSMVGRLDERVEGLTRRFDRFEDGVDNRFVGLSKKVDTMQANSEVRSAALKKSVDRLVAVFEKRAEE